MTRKTKVRIVGDPDLAKKVSASIMARFQTKDHKVFDTTPYRYAKTPGIAIYITVEKPRVAHT